MCFFLMLAAVLEKSFHEGLQRTEYSKERENPMADFCHVILHHAKGQHDFFIFFKSFSVDLQVASCITGLRPADPGSELIRAFDISLLNKPWTVLQRDRHLTSHCRKWPQSIASCTTECSTRLQQPPSLSYVRLEYLFGLMCCCFSSYLCYISQPISTHIKVYMTL